TIAGVILNQVGGQRHETKLRQAVEYYTGLPVIGAVRKNPELQIDERHLGLIPSNEMGGSQAIIRRWGEIVAEQVDMGLLLEAAADVSLATAADPVQNKTADVKIGIARDAAFGFYYPDDLLAFKRAGAELIPVDLINDSFLPAVDGLFIGGGFPETSMRKLSENEAMRQKILDAVESGLPVYAECGGLMYLSRQISWRGKTCPMVGAIPCDTVMFDKPQGRGYVKLRETGKGGWSSSVDGGFNAHEFHYSRVVNLAPDLEYAYRVKRGFGIDGEKDGIMVNNVLACYAHQRQAGGNRWVDNFTQFVRDQRSRHD
ncbi:MAG: hydrogenobyrinic acid a,c-diamide synthase (glutamine-hydrolyzing), partial [Gammaproteobacteria bacterium]